MKITQFKQILEKYHSTYDRYFKTKMFDIDYGGCGDFAYLLKQPLQTLIDHFGMSDKVSVSYVFLSYAYSQDSLDQARENNKNCIKKFNKGLVDKLEDQKLKDIMDCFDFCHVMIKIKLGSVSWFLDSDSIHINDKELEEETGKFVVFDSDDFELLKNLNKVDMWNDSYLFHSDFNGALENIGKPLQTMANNLIKKL